MIDGIIDFHSHILPKVDDGSRSVEESIAMLRKAAEQGINHVIATPHFYANHHTMEQFLQRRRDAYDALTQAVAADDTLPQLILGAEVKLFEGLSQIDDLDQLTIDEMAKMVDELIEAHGDYMAMYR